MNLNMKYIVYITVNLVNNKIYIGQHKTETPEVFDGYLGCGININIPSSYQRPSSPLHFAVKKYGVKNFKRFTLKVFDTVEEALKCEAELVDYKFLKRKDTYNAQLGGETGHKYLPVNQFSDSGVFIKTWNTMQEAAEFYSVSHTAILNAVKFKGRCKGFLWSKEHSINPSEFLLAPEKRCYRYDADTGKYLGMYPSIKEAAIDMGVTQQSIGNATLTGYRIKDSYFSKKLMEEFHGGTKVSIKNKPIYVYDLEGTYITELKNGKEIKRFFNINSTNPITVAVRKHSNYKDYQISLQKVDSLPKFEAQTFFKKPVLVYDIKGTLIEELPSIAETMKKYSQGAYKVLKGIQQQCRGFIFKYKQ